MDRSEAHRELKVILAREARKKQWERPARKTSRCLQELVLPWHPLDDQFRFAKSWDWLPKAEEEVLYGPITFSRAICDLIGDHVKVDPHSWQCAAGSSWSSTPRASDEEEGGRDEEDSLSGFEDDPEVGSEVHDEGTEVAGTGRNESTVTTRNAKLGKGYGRTGEKQSAAAAELLETPNDGAECHWRDGRSLAAEGHGARRLNSSGYGCFTRGNGKANEVEEASYAEEEQSAAFGQRVAFNKESRVVDSRCEGEPERQEASRLWPSAPPSNAGPDFYKAMVRMWAERGERMHAELWMARMIGAGYTADRATFTAIIDVCTRIGDTAGATQWVLKMVEAGLMPDGKVYSQVNKTPRSCAGARALAEQRVSRLCGARLSQEDLCQLAKESLRAGAIADAEEWVRVMLEEGIGPDSSILEGIIRACARSGDSRRAVLWFWSMLDGGLVPGPDSCDRMLQACYLSGEDSVAADGLATAREMASSMLEAKLQLAQHSCDDLLGRFLDAEEFNTVQDLLDAMVSFGITQRWGDEAAKTWERVICRLAKVGQWIAVEGCLLSMLEKGLPPSEPCYDAVVEACAAAGQEDHAERWLAKLMAAGLRPRVARLQQLTRLWAERGLHSKAAFWWSTAAEEAASCDAEQLSEDSLDSAACSGRAAAAKLAAASRAAFPSLDSTACSDNGEAESHAEPGSCSSGSPSTPVVLSLDQCIPSFAAAASPASGRSTPPLPRCAGRGRAFRLGCDESGADHSSSPSTGTAFVGGRSLAAAEGRRQALPCDRQAPFGRGATLAPSSAGASSTPSSASSQPDTSPGATTPDTVSSSSTGLRRKVHLALTAMMESSKPPMQLEPASSCQSSPALGGAPPRGSAQCAPDAAASSGRSWPATGARTPGTFAALHGKLPAAGPRSMQAHPCSASDRVVSPLRHACLDRFCRDSNAEGASHIAPEEEEQWRRWPCSCGSSAASRDTPAPSRPESARQGQAVLPHLRALHDLVQEAAGACAQEGCEKALRWVGSSDMSIRAMCCEVTKSAKAKSDAQCLQWFERVLHSNSTPDVVACNSMITVLSRSGHRNLGERWLAATAEAGVAADDITYNTLISAAMRSGSLEEAEAWLSRMVEAGVRPTNNSFQPLVQTHLRRRDAQRAGECLQRMVSHGVAPEQVLCNRVIDLCACSGDRPSAEKWLRFMIDARVKPDEASYNSVLHACGRSGDWQDADRIFREMQESRLRPDTRTYNNLIDACVRSSKIKEAEAWRHRMFKAGLQPDAFTFSALAGAYLRAKKPSEAERLLAEMRRAGFEPDKRLLTRVQEACKGC